MPRPNTGRKRRSIGLYITDEEEKWMKIKTRDLKAKYGYSRNEVLRVILTQLLDDEHLIDLVQIKGGLRNKNIKCNRSK